VTKIQKEVLRAVFAAHPGWYRAVGSGQRVTLASLYRVGVLVRRAWRGREGEADAAHEYQLSPSMIEARTSSTV
jgi:hypothetical protein